MNSDADKASDKASEMTRSSARLWRSIASLADSSAPRPASQRVDPAALENLVIEFDEAYTLFVEGFVTLPSEMQMISLQAVDTKLAGMVAQKDATLWTGRAATEHSVWREVSALARRVLDAFDWPECGSELQFDIELEPN